MAPELIDVGFRHDDFDRTEQRGRLAAGKTIWSRVLVLSHMYSSSSQEFATIHRDCLGACVWASDCLHGREAAFLSQVCARFSLFASNRRRDSLHGAAGMRGGVCPRSVSRPLCQANEHD